MTSDNGSNIDDGPCPEHPEDAKAWMRAREAQQKLKNQSETHEIEIDKLKAGYDDHRSSISESVDRIRVMELNQEQILKTIEGVSDNIDEMRGEIKEYNSRLADGSNKFSLMEKQIGDLEDDKIQREQFARDIRKALLIYILPFILLSALIVAAGSFGFSVERKGASDAGNNKGSWYYQQKKDQRMPVENNKAR